MGSQLSQLVGLLVGGKLPSLHGQDCQHVGWSRSLGSFHLQGKSKAEAEFTPNLEDPLTSSHICIHLTPSWIDGNFWKAAAFWFVFLHLEVREGFCETFRAIPARSRWDWIDWCQCWVPIVLSKWCQRRAAVNGRSVSRSPVNRRGL